MTMMDGQTPQEVTQARRRAVAQWRSGGKCHSWLTKQWQNSFGYDPRVAEGYIPAIPAIRTLHLSPKCGIITWDL